MERLIYIIAICQLHISYSQNLCPNGSFEEFRSCPTKFSDNYLNLKTIGWFSPSKGTPDYFNSCSIFDASTPKNWAGTKIPVDGNAYIGIYSSTENSSYREFIGIEILNNLTKDSIYLLEFYYSASVGSEYIVKNLQAGFSSNRIKVDHDSTIVPNRILEASMNQSLEYWMKFNLEFVADGSERFLYIGNFNSNKLTKNEFYRKRVPMLMKSAYYYVDKVNLRAKYEKPITQSVYFDFDSFQLKDVESKKLREFLNSNDPLKNKKLLVKAYTDTTGRIVYNNDLSIKRAESIVEIVRKINYENIKISVEPLGELHELNLPDSLLRKVDIIIKH